MINSKKQSMYIIYALCCPYTDEVHYVGKSSSGMLRPLSHISKSHSNKVNEWIDELKKFNLYPLIKILEYVEKDENIDEREFFWIQRYAQKGMLLNKKSVTASIINSKLDNELHSEEYHATERIRNFIKQKRKLLKLSQPELASKAGVGIRFLRELEQGHKTSFNLYKVQRVLNMFGCMLDVVPMIQQDI